MNQLQIVKRAVTERWALTDEHRRNILQTMMEILLDPEVKKHTKCLAVSMLVKMDGLNIRVMELEERSKPKHLIHHHSDMSTEQLQQLVQEKLLSLGMSGINLNAPGPAIAMLEQQIERNNL